MTVDTSFIFLHLTIDTGGHKFYIASIDDGHK